MAEQVDRYRSWLYPGVADYMRDLVTLELEQATYRQHDPFRYFLGAMMVATERWSLRSLVDAGCGVGHYSELLARQYPKIAYTGFDFSEHMIARARQLWPGRMFLVADAKEFDYAPYDVILASSLVEVMDQWSEGAAALCKAAQRVLLHRVRLGGGPTGRQEHIGYPGQPTFVWVHNERELLDFFERGGLDMVWSEHWQGQAMATYLFERG